MAQNKGSGLNTSNEEKLLLLCARTRMGDKIKYEIRSLVKQEMNWDYLLQISKKHRVTPLLYWQLNSICAADVPREVMEHLKAYFHENARKNLLFMGELLKILELFEAHGITAIPYKGPVLAVQAYGNLAFREFDDLDIFVHKENIQKVKQLLIAQNYETRIDLKDAQEKFFLESQREYKFKHSETNLALEIHWKLVGLSFSFSRGSEFLSNPKSFGTLNFSGVEISTLSPEDALLILCLHASGHRWERLSWICDISQFIQANNINWEEVMERGTELGVERILLVNFSLATDIFGLNLMEAVSEQIKSDKSVKELTHGVKTLLFDEQHENKFSSKAYLRLKIRENYRNKIEDFLRIFFLPTNKEWSHSTLPSLLIPFYYILRPFKVLKDY